MYISDKVIFRKFMNIQDTKIMVSIKMYGLKKMSNDEIGTHEQKIVNTDTVFMFK